MTKVQGANRRFHRKTDGQAMAEFCVAAPLFVLLLWSIWYLSDLYIMKHKTLVASRYGTWLLSRYDNLPRDSVNLDRVRQLIARHYFAGSQDGLEVEEQHIGGEDNNQFQDDVNQNAGSQGQWLDDVVGLLQTRLMGSDSPTVYSLKVSHQFPRIFGAVDLSEYSDEDFHIQSEHYVGGNSWDGGRVDVHDPMDVIGELMGSIFEDLI